VSRLQWNTEKSKGCNLAYIRPSCGLYFKGIRKNKEKINDNTAKTARNDFRKSENAIGLLNLSNSAFIQDIIFMRVASVCFWDCSFRHNFQAIPFV
jgi:hypothetical protein